MPEQTPKDPHAPLSSPRRSLLRRLRPFLRRDLRPRLVSAAVAAGLVGGLSWFGVSALTEMDSAAARDLRVSLAIEDTWEVCDGPGEPRCAFDDRLQQGVDAEFEAEQRLRRAILGELEVRLNGLVANLDSAAAILQADAAAGLGELRGLSQEPRLRDLLLAAIDLQPLLDETHTHARTRALERAAYRGRAGLLAEITSQRAEYAGHRDAVAQLLDYVTEESDGEAIPSRTYDRQVLWAELFNRDPYGDGGQLAAWILGGASPTIAGSLADLSQRETARLAAAIRSPRDTLWRGALRPGADPARAIHKPSIRYTSPVAPERRWQLFGACLFGLAAFFLVVVGPVATATQTAREREAGTLPVLRMTGLSAGDLALAMALGPNVFAAVAGALLLLPAILALGLTAGLSALLLPLGILLFLGVTTHMAAIGLGDALGHRVNALMVGALMACGIAVPGLFGAALTTVDVSGTGLLLGPLPPVLAGFTELTGLPGSAGALQAFDADLGPILLTYALLLQGMLGMIALLSWRRRVEQAWTPLLRPAEGVALAIASIGCSGLTLVDLSARLHTQSFDNLNLVTALACAFLVPLLGWLFVASLPRPARASAAVSHREARRAFWRYQGILALTLGIVGVAYHVVMDRAGLASEPSEVMWATLTQVILVAETAIATLLLASRHRDARVRIGLLGGALLVLQAGFVGIVYHLEASFVAEAHSVAHPFLLGMGASPTWIAVMILLWSAGIGLIVAALLRDRDQIAAERADRESAAQGSEEEPEGRHRWLH